MVIENPHPFSLSSPPGDQIRKLKSSDNNNDLFIVGR